MSKTLREMEREHITSEYADSTMNQILNIDCLEHMRKVPDNYYDLILTDPPYGIGASNSSLGLRKEHKHKRTWDKKAWDMKVPSSEIFEEIFRISKNQIIWGGNYFNIGACKNYIVWDKKISGAVPFAHCEMAWTSYDKAPTIFRYAIQSSGETRVHPTQKPIKLFEYCIKEYENIKTIYDPFGGSGTTAIACKSLGLNWCVTELEEDYCKIGEERLKKVQGALF